MTDEEFVRSVWQDVVIEYDRRDYCIYPSDLDLEFQDAWYKTPEEAWANAAEFTRDRLEEIRQVRAEIESEGEILHSAYENVLDAVNLNVVDPFLIDYVKDICHSSRILARLKVIKRDLMEGIK